VHRSDEDIMGAVGEGDRAALEALVYRYHAQLLGFFFRMLAGDRATAEDLTQETFIRLLRQTTYSRDRAFRPWLFAVAANLARDHLRQASRRPFRDDQPFETLEDPKPGPEALAIAGALVDDIARAVARMPEEYRMTLILRYGSDLSLEEIAAVLDIPLGTVKSRLSVGLRRLRDALRTESLGS
jgi:RNA polymerase sigma factor (sigma-70 family)